MKRFFAHMVSPKFRGVITATALVLALLAVLCAGPARADGFTWHSAVDELSTHLNRVVSTYRGGDAKGAKRGLTQAYFGVFEGRKLEGAIRKTMGQAHAYDVESTFSDMRKMIGKDVSPDDLAKAVQTLIAQLHTDADALDAEGVPQEVYNVQ